MSSFRICQITDIHITMKPDKTINGIDVISNFENILTEIVNYKPDLLVLTGDLCFSRNDKNVYSFIKGKLDSAGIPYCIIPGNHDKTAPLADVFNYALTEKGNLYYVKDIDNYRLIFTDSSRHKLSSEQLILLEKDLETDLKPVLFIHHPPAIAGVPFMDRKYPLINMKVLQNVLSTYNGVIPVFCGHYHHEKEFTQGNLNIYMTPSTYFQISDQSTHFKVGSTKAGWRNITLSENVETEVLYL